MVLVTLLDALRHDYPAADLPFLRELTRGGLSTALKPPMGFEPDFAFLAGLQPDEADGGMQFWRDPERSPFRFTRRWPRWLNRLPPLPNRILRRFLMLWARRQSGSPQLSTAAVPFELLHQFSPSAPTGLDQSGFCPTRTVFDHLRTAGRKWLYHGVPTRRLTIDSAVRRAEAELRPPCEFAYFHVGDLDHVGHEFGPDSPQRERAMRRIDEGLRHLFTLAASRFKQLHFVVFGDHGMCNVTRHLDVEKVLKPLPCRSGRDYVAFFDSTMARFWFLSERARPEVCAALEPLEGGHCLDRPERDRYCLNYRHTRFGDEFFVADAGVLILPNFYQRNHPVQGMHGYVHETSDQHSALILHSPLVARQFHLKGPQDMRRIFPTLLELLGISDSQARGGQSLLCQTA